MKPPFLYKGKKPLKIPFETVVSVVKTVIEAGDEAKFIARCKELNAVVTIAPEHVNFVKSYLFASRSHKTSLAARDVVTSARCDPPT